MSSNFEFEYQAGQKSQLKMEKSTSKRANIARAFMKTEGARSCFDAIRRTLMLYESDVQRKPAGRIEESTWKPCEVNQYRSEMPIWRAY